MKSSGPWSPNSVQTPTSTVSGRFEVWGESEKINTVKWFHEFI
jgi:hypothetical protein